MSFDEIASREVTALIEERLNHEFGVQIQSFKKRLDQVKVTFAARGAIRSGAAVRAQIELCCDAAIERVRIAYDAILSVLRAKGIAFADVAPSWVEGQLNRFAPDSLSCFTAAIVLVDARSVGTGAEATARAAAESRRESMLNFKLLSTVTCPTKPSYPADATMTQASNPPKKCFISYSHDSKDHRDAVLGFAQRLRRDGIDAQIDRYVEGTPAESWPRWIQNQIEWADFVLMICTQKYYQRFRGHEEHGVGRGVDFEAYIITQRIYDESSRGNKFVAIFLGAVDGKHIPDPVRGRTLYSLTTEQGYEDLVRFLRGASGVTPYPLGAARRVEKESAAPSMFAQSFEVAPDATRFGPAPARSRPFGDDTDRSTNGRASSSSRAGLATMNPIADAPEPALAVHARRAATVLLWIVLAWTGMATSFAIFRTTWSSRNRASEVAALKKQFEYLSTESVEAERTSRGNQRATEENGRRLRYSADNGYAALEELIDSIRTDFECGRWLSGVFIGINVVDLWDATDTLAQQTGGRQGGSLGTSGAVGSLSVGMTPEERERTGREYIRRTTDACDAVLPMVMPAEVSMLPLSLDLRSLLVVDALVFVLYRVLRGRRATAATVGTGIFIAILSAIAISRREAMIRSLETQLRTDRQWCEVFVEPPGEHTGVNNGRRVWLQAAGAVGNRISAMLSDGFPQIGFYDSETASAMATVGACCRNITAAFLDTRWKDSDSAKTIIDADPARRCESAIGHVKELRERLEKKYR